MKPGYVYMLTNKPGGVSYIGATDDLAKRTLQHRSRAVPGLTKKYKGERLVWFECFDDLQEARLMEVWMKRWKREWKINRIEARYPEWRDLYEDMNLFA